MGYQVYDCPAGHKFRHAGYGVPAYCDHPDCNEKIDRGLSYRCGEPHNEDGCGLHFCGKHLLMSGRGQLCERCKKHKPSFTPKPEHPEWVEWLLTDDSWKEWREENPEWVKHISPTPTNKED